MSAISFQASDGGFDLARFRKSPEFFLGENQGLVGLDFKIAAGALDQFRVGIESLFEVGRQTGGPGLVVSIYAVFNGETHCNLVLCFLGRSGPNKGKLFLHDLYSGIEAAGG